VNAYCDRLGDFLIFFDISKDPPWIGIYVSSLIFFFLYVLFYKFRGIERPSIKYLVILIYLLNTVDQIDLIYLCYITLEKLATMRRMMQSAIILSTTT
jgi:hypothetical protein